MGSLYLDHGPGFISDDTKKVLASLRIPLIHGKVAYPQGHAKIERFNSTITTAAELHFNRDYGPIVSSDGGFLAPPP